MADVAWIQRQDTLERLILDGVLSCTVTPTSLVTHHRVEDQLVITDSIIEEPLTVELSAIVSETPTVAGLLVGPERVEEVIWFFERAAKSSLTLYIPSTPIIRNLAVESRPYTRRVMDGVDLSLRMVQILYAQSTTVDLGRVVARPNMRAGKATAGAQGEAPARRVAVKLQREIDSGKRPATAP